MKIEVVERFGYRVGYPNDREFTGWTVLRKKRNVGYISTDLVGWMRVELSGVDKCRITQLTGCDRFMMAGQLKVM